jgi:hypothetical protein
VDPEERTWAAGGLPFCICGTVNPPCFRSGMLGFTSKIMSFQRIRWRKPFPDVLLQLFTCGTVPCTYSTMTTVGNNSRRNWPIISIIWSDRVRGHCCHPNVPRASRTSSASALPSRINNVQRWPGDKPSSTCSPSMTTRIFWTSP